MPIDGDELIRSIVTDLSALGTQITDNITLGFSAYNEHTLKKMPIPERPTDQIWSDHLKEVLERQMYRDLDSQEQKRKKPEGLK